MEAHDEEFIPRPYQTKIAELAKTKNTIIFLPTGSGKTYIAVLVMKHFLSLERRPFSAGGKRCFFIVNTVVLVEQQAAVLERHLPINRAGRYFGAMNVDSWSRQMWQREFEKHETLVMTAEIFRMTLAHGFILPSQIAVAIFDECHRAVGDSPMHEAALLITNSPGNKPRMIGLSATLLNANAKTLMEAQVNVAELLRTFDAVLGSIGGDGVLCFSTNPKEEVIPYKKEETSSREMKACLAIIRRAIDYSGVFAGIDDFGRRIQSTEKLKKARKDVKNVLFEAEFQLKSLGVYGGSLSAVFHTMQFEAMKISENNPSILLQLTQAVNAVSAMHGLLTRLMSANEPGLRRAYEFSSSKVQTLVHLLIKVRENCAKDDFRCLVLVERKMSARMVCTVLKHIAKIEEFSFIKPVYLVGNSRSPEPFPGNAEDFERMNRHALKLFYSGELNVLVSTDVTEEGVDIPLCNCVVKFDKILSYRSYMQSKGRARSKDSQYYVLEEEENVAVTNSKLKGYAMMQNHLTGIVTDDETSADALSDGLVSDEKSETYQTNRATLVDVAAASILAKYISIFNFDKYSVQTMEWEIIKVSRDGFPTLRNDCFDTNGMPCHFIAVLTLPQAVPHRLKIQSDVKRNMKCARRNAAFKMCVELHKIGELDDDLVPVSPEAHFTPNPNWWPHSNIADELKSKMIGDTLGTKDRGQLYFAKVPDCLTDCAPTSLEEAYLHLLKINPKSDNRPRDRQYKFLYNLAQQEGSYAILTTTQMPKVCPYSVYSRIGELDVDFIPNYKAVSFSDDEWALLDSFSQTLFVRMIPCTTCSDHLMRYGGKDYMVVPTKSDRGSVSIDWEALEASLSILDGLPSLESRLTMEVSNETYLGAVITPWYRVDNSIAIVTKIEQKMNAMSKFPGQDCNFRERYIEEYHVETVRPELPLLEAQCVSKFCNGFKKGKSTFVSDSSKKHFIPDLMKVNPVSSTLWIKAIAMPSVLMRLERLLVAEEVRSRIAREASLGFVTPPSDFVWRRLEEEIEEKDNGARVSELEVKQVARPVPVVESVCKEEKDGCQKDLVAEFWDGDAGNQDIYFLKNCFDVVKYDFYFSMNEKTFDIVAEVPIPFPRLLRSVGNPEGLQLNKVLTALTAPSANDIVNYERMETLGDSFLKVVVSLFVYEACPLKSEGLLTSLRSSFIGNRNLFHCALNKRLPEVMVVRDGNLPQGWSPPKFVQSDQKMVQRKLHPKVEVKQDVEELIVKFSSVSPNEKPRFVTIQALNDWEKARFTGAHLISDKTAADVVEALLGATLLDCGWNGALDLLTWFEIVPYTVTRKDGTVVPLKKLLQSGYYEPMSPSGGNIPATKEVDLIQAVLGYTFKEPKILRQALTHPSYDAHNSYERLEFIGDAVLDFLITSYIYENCGPLSPGKVTDLRSALVNNVTFAALAAKYGLNRFLLMFSPVLMQAVNTFIKYQRDNNHKIDGDVLILCDDGEVRISDLITVPKSLADLFEALAGAIFFDSGRDFTAVWEVFYPMMHPVIVAFCENIPIDPVRMLYEKVNDWKVSFEFNKDTLNNRIVATCQLEKNSDKRRFHGYGGNKKSAKKAAAKLALHCIRSNKC